MVVDTKYSPLSAILQHVEGASWIVNYFAQVLSADSEIGALQLDVAAVYQQYALVESMELKVTGALSTEEDEESKSMIVSGVATTYPNFIPNKGDVFLADIGDGREAVFTVLNAEKKSYLKDAYYQITYELTDYANDVIKADLARKTVKITKFVKDFLYYGQNPQVLSEDYADLVDFKKSYQELLGLYFRDFFSQEHQTLIVPGQSQVTYDAFLPKALLDWIGVDEHPAIAKIRQPNVAGDQAMQALTIWDCLGRMAANTLPMALQQARLLNTEHFRVQPALSGVYYSGMRQVVYPFDDRTDVDASYEAAGGAPTVDSTTELTRGGRRYTDLTRLLANTANGFDYAAEAEGTLPDVIRVTDDEYYVFSKPFYRGETPLSSKLEVLVMQALRQEPLDKAILTRLCRTAMKWENVERFYYIPVLFALLKVAIRTN